METKHQQQQQLAISPTGGANWYPDSVSSRQATKFLKTRFDALFKAAKNQR